MSSFSKWTTHSTCSCSGSRCNRCHRWRWPPLPHSSPFRRAERMSMCGRQESVVASVERHDSRRRVERWRTARSLGRSFYLILAISRLYPCKCCNRDVNVGAMFRAREKRRRKSSSSSSATRHQRVGFISRYPRKNTKTSSSTRRERMRRENCARANRKI